MTNSVDFRCSRVTFDTEAQKWRPVVLEMAGSKTVAWEPLAELADTAEGAHAIADAAIRSRTIASPDRDEWTFYQYHAQRERV